MKILKWPLIYIGSVIPVLIILAIISTMLGINPANFPDFVQTHSLLPVLILGASLIYFLLKEYKSLNIKSVVTMKEYKYIYLVLLIPVVYNIAVNTVFVDILSETSYDTLYSLVSSLIGVGIIGPILEEYVFRGLTYNYLKEKFSVNLSILFSSLIFGIIHFNPFQICYAFILGLMLGYVYSKTSNIKITILMHIFANITSIFTIYILKTMI